MGHERFTSFQIPRYADYYCKSHSEIIASIYLRIYNSLDSTRRHQIGATNLQNLNQATGAGYCEEVKC